LKCLLQNFFNNQKGVYMKSILAIVSILIFNQLASAAITPMHVIEKASYQIASLVKKNKINSSFLTDITTVTIAAANNEFNLHLTSPTNQVDVSNTLDLVMSADAKFKSFATQFVGVSSQSPILNGITTAVALDLGAEAFVDHLHESQENVLVAEHVQSIDLMKIEGGVNLKIHLADARIYSITLNNNGDVIARGFN
jgi:hypothetical protein